MQEMTDFASIQGTIFGFQPFSVHDGPGIRTTVFFKGCHLRCLWCHNPEGISGRPLLSFSPNLCIGCGNCVRICPEVHQIRDGVHTLDRIACNTCGRCVSDCPAGALAIVGNRITAGEVALDLARDKRYYETSGGGATLSGGEPLLQAGFAEAILRLVRQEGIHCAVETCGSVPFSAFEQVAPHTDLFLYDLKETEPQRHLEFTGVALAPVLENLRKLKRLHGGILIRCPIIPSLNDRPDHFQALAALSLELDLPVEILAYHRLGVTKSGRMGTTPQDPYEQADPATVESWRNALREQGARVTDS
jgi:pyruvate formate lyase activating enzyme